MAYLVIVFHHFERDFPQLPSIMESSLQKAAKISQQHPKPDVKFSYGTAGFRMPAENLDSVMFRMGLLAVLRSKVKGGQVIGVVVTASHNPVHDNGVKLVDPLGEMLEPSWEKHASDLANAQNIVDVLSGVLTEHGIDWGVPANVFAARDTRPSGAQFVQALKDGVEALGGSFHDYGKVTFTLADAPDAFSLVKAKQLQALNLSPTVQFTNLTV